MSMSIVNQPDEILIIIMSYIDLDSIFRLGLCAQKFSLLVVDERLWELKLDSDYHALKYAFVNCRQSYKWQSRVASKLPKLLKKKYNNISSDINQNAISKMLLNMGPHNLTDLKIIMTFGHKNGRKYSCTEPILSFCFENSDSLLNDL
jgi:hypothetical protein